MPLTADQWLIRIGMTPGLINGIKDKSEGLRRIGQLVLWRFTDVMNLHARHDWGSNEGQGTRCACYR